MQYSFSSKFVKSLNKINNPQVVELLEKTIINIENSNQLNEIKNLKKLKGFTNAYRIKISTYRIGLYLENDLLVLYFIAHRKEIYRFFP